MGLSVFGQDYGIVYIGEENGMCLKMHVGIIRKAGT